MLKRATPINLVLIAAVALAAAAIATSRWQTTWVTGRPPTNYAEAIEMRNAALRKLHQIEAAYDGAAADEQPKLLAAIKSEVAEISRLERRIDQLKR